MENGHGGGVAVRQFELPGALPCRPPALRHIVFAPIERVWHGSAERTMDAWAANMSQARGDGMCGQ